jgi:hypothetical protein
MTTTRLARVVSYALVGIVLVASGTYLLVYLYRWEWNRAVLSGIFFVAAEVALGIAMLLARLRRIELQLDARTSSGPAGSPPAGSPSNDGEAPFSWLDPSKGGTAVFVPVLMGAGVILSVLAIAVEKVAGAVARDHLSETAAESAVESPSTARRLPVAVASVMAVFLMVAAVDLLADATQNRPDRPQAGVTTIVVDVQLRDAGTTVDEAAEALWVACRSTFGSQIPHAQVAGVGESRATVVLDTRIGQHARRRLVGCLEDATLDRIQASVQKVTTAPTAPPRPLGTV